MVMFNAISFSLFFAYFPGILYALPGDRVSLVDFGFGAGLNDDDSDSLVTQFLVPSGTSSGGDQTTFEYVEIEFTTIDSGATVAQTTFTGKLVASASGWVVDATYTPDVSGTPTIVTVAEACQVTAVDSGECSAVINDETLFTTEAAITQFFAVSSSPTLSLTSPITSSAPSITSSATISATVAVSSGNHRKPSVGTVVGGTVAGVLVVCSLVAGWFTLRRRRQRSGQIVDIDPSSYYETPSRQQTLLPVSQTHLDPFPMSTLASIQHSLESGSHVEGTVDSKQNVVLRWQEQADDAREELQRTQTSLNALTRSDHNQETDGVAMQQRVTEILERLRRLEEQGLPPPNYVS